MHNVYLAVVLVLTLYMVDGLLDVDGRKAEFKQLMRSTRRNYIVYGSFIFMASASVVDWVLTPQHGQFLTMPNVVFVTLGTAAIVLLTLNLARAWQAHRHV